MLQRERPKKFVWILRECGSYLFPIGKYRRHQINERLVRSQAIEHCATVWRGKDATKAFYVYDGTRLEFVGDAWITLDWMERENRRARGEVGKIVADEWFKNVLDMAKKKGHDAWKRLQAILDLYRFYGDFPVDWYWNAERPFQSNSPLDFTLTGWQYNDETGKTVDRLFVYCLWREDERDWSRNT
jgi:hypothetical protein